MYVVGGNLLRGHASKSRSADPSGRDTVIFVVIKSFKKCMYVYMFIQELYDSKRDEILFE